MTTPFPIFDADNHLYERAEALTTYLPADQARKIRFVQVGRHMRIAVKGRITEFIPNPTFEKVARPGAHADYYRNANTEGLTLREMTGEPIDCEPAFREPGPRLERMDELGVHRALVFPTIANLIEYTAVDDPDLAHAAIHAINGWIHDTWTFDHADRLYAVPVVTLAIVERAVEELEWLLARGAKAILIRPAPASGLRGSRSIGLPEFDPFWARVQEAGVLVCMHGAMPPLTSYFELWEPEATDNAFRPSALKQMLLQHREIEDALAALICHGALSRFPGLKVLSVENGADWVPHLMQQLGVAHERLPQEFPEHPVEVFRRNVYVSPFWESNIEELIELLGTDHVVFGSDYPHPEGMARPVEYVDFLAEHASLDDATVRKVMCENGNELLGLAVPST